MTAWQQISNKYLEQIISLLNKAGYLETARGNSGGYKLAKKPKEYTVGDILRATEGELAPIYCLTEDGECERQKSCKTYYFWKGLDNVINDIYILNYTNMIFFNQESEDILFEKIEIIYLSDNLHSKKFGANSGFLILSKGCPWLFPNFSSHFWQILKS